MHDLEPPGNDALIDEIHALRSENQRLGSLLGLDQASRHQVTQPWERRCSPTRIMWSSQAK